MEQYIKKSSLIAEIKKRFDEYLSSILKHYDACKEAKAQELGKILTILDTLEVKEINLEDEVDKILEANDWDYDEMDFYDFAKHFFELGLKAQKEDNSLEKFKSLQHITGDLHQTLEDWGYAPNLYFFDGMWHVSWISCEDGDGIKDFEGTTPEEAIDKSYNWFHSTFCNG